MQYIYFLLVVAAAYVIGSIPTGYLIVKHFKGIDIRETGSGSTGATNVKRVMGTKWFFIVLFLDAMKGLIPVLLSKYLEVRFNILLSWHILPVAVSVAVIIGHSKSLFLGFSGGKSVASGVGTILGLNWIAGMAIAVIWSVIAYFSRYISLASIIALLLAPVAMWVCKQPKSYIIYCALGALYIVWLHRSNILRLIEGEENKVR